MVPIKVNLCNRADYGGVRAKNPEWIVMHYTANDGDSDEGNGKYFHNTIVKASAHYFVDDDSITSSVPLEMVAWHCGANQYFHPTCRNWNSVGVELCDTVKNGVHDVTEKTLQNAAELVAWLCGKYGIPTSHIIRHYDVTHKICPAFWCGAGVDGIVKFRERVEDEMGAKIEQSVVIVQGAEKPVRRVLVEGQNFLNLRDLAKALAGVVDLEIGNRGSIATITVE